MEEPPRPAVREEAPVHAQVPGQRHGRGPEVDRGQQALALFRVAPAPGAPVHRGNDAHEDLADCPSHGRAGAKMRPAVVRDQKRVEHKACATGSAAHTTWAPKVSCDSVDVSRCIKYSDAPTVNEVK